MKLKLLTFSLINQNKANKCLSYQWVEKGLNSHLKHWLTKNTAM